MLHFAIVSDRKATWKKMLTSGLAAAAGNMVHDLVILANLKTSFHARSWAA